MKSQPLILPALILILFASLGCSQDPDTPADVAADALQDTTHAPAPLPEAPEFDSVHDLMEEVADSYKFLRRNTESGQADELLSHSATIRALIAQAKTMTPKQVKRAQGEEQTKLTQAFQTHLNAVPPLLDQYDAAIHASDRDAAAQTVKKLHDAEEEGHHALGVEDEHH